jgi:hypothetical protein
VDRTAVHSRVATADRSTRILPVEPPRRGPARLRTVLFRYLAVAFVLLALVIVTHPQDGDGAVGRAKPWDYQQEQVDVHGRGVLNAFARTTVRATAWLARASIERQRDVFRVNLFDFLVGAGAAQAVGAWRAANAAGLVAVTQLAMVGLVVYGVLLRPARRTWLVAALLLLAVSVVVTRPQATVRLAAAPSLAVPDAMVQLTGRALPGGGLEGASGPEDAQRRLLGRYWTSFVANPLSRMQTGTSVLATAPPGKKPGVLDGLRENISAVNDWALGRHGPERVFIATSALAYVLPFAVALGVLAMVAACAQTLLFLLCLAGLAVLPFAVAGRRQRGALIRYWVLPLVGAAAVLALASLGSFAVVRAANALHASDEYVGVLLAGSTWPLLVGFLVWRRAARRRRDGQERPVLTLIGS